MLRYAVVIALLLCVWQSAVILMSSYFALRADRLLVAEPANFRKDQARELLNRGHQLDPANPVLLEGLFRVVARDGSEPVTAGVLGRQLVSLRPRKAEYWAALFALNLEAGLVNEETRRALHESSRVGPYEPGANLRLVRAATQNWFLLSPDMRDDVIDAAVRSLDSASDHHDRYLAAMLRERGFLTLVCRRLRDAGGSHTECQAADDGA